MARTPLDIPLATYFVLVVIATLFSSNFGLSIFGPYKWREGLVYLLSFGVIFWGAATYLRGLALKRALIWGALGATIVAVYAMAQRLGFDFTTWFANADPTRAFSTLGNPVYLGAYTLLVAPIAVGLALASPKGSRERTIGAIVAALTVIAAGVSYSRGAWLGLLIAFALMVAVLPRRRTAVVWTVVLVLALGVAAAIPVAGLQQGFGSRVASVFTTRGSNAPRIVLWRGALDLIGRNPLVGVGPEAFKQEFARIKPDNWPSIDPEDKSARAHNDLLNVAATTGIPSAIAYLVALGLLVVRGIWVLMSERGREAAFGSPDGHEARRALAAGLLAACVGYLFYVQFEFTMIDVTPLFWMTAGALAAATAGLGTGGRFREWSLPEWATSSAALWWWITGIGIALVIAASVFVRPAVADVYFGKALAEESAGDLGGAIVDLHTALWLAPQEDYYLFFLGKTFLMFAEVNNSMTALAPAIGAYEKALILNRADTTLLNSIGSAYYLRATRFGQAADFSRAEYYYKRTLIYDPTNSEALSRLGQVAFYQGQYGAASVYLDRATALAPDVASYHFNLATAYENLGEPANALAEYKKALKLQPGDADSKKAIARLAARLNKKGAVTR